MRPFSASVRGLAPSLVALLAASLMAGEASPPADAALARIHDPDPIVRERASLAAARAGRAEAVPLLVAAVRQPLRYGNREAVLALSWLGAAALPGLRELLADPDPFCRAEALRVLRELGPSGAELAEPAAAALRDDNRYVRRGAALALAAMGPAAAKQTPAVVQAMNEDAWNRSRVVGALVALGDAGALRTALAGPHRELVLKSLHQNPAACRALSAELLAAAADPVQLIHAARAVARLGPAAGPHLPQLAGLLTGAANEDAIAAFTMLGRDAAGQEAALARAIRGSQPGSGERGAVVAALRAIGTPAARAALLGFVNDTGLRNETRLSALDAALNIDGAERGALLTGLLTDTDAKVLRGVLDRLRPGQAPTPALLAVFERAQAHFSAQVTALREQARSGAKPKKGGGDKGKGKDKPSDPPDAGVGSLAAGLILAQEPSQAVAGAWLPTLLAAAPGTELAFDANLERVRKEAVWAFVRRAPPSACEPLRALWEGDDAGNLLEIFGNAAANPALAKALAPRARAVLAHADPRVQVMAAYLILRSGEGDLAPAVAAMIAGIQASAVDADDDRQATRAADARRRALEASGHLGGHAAALRPALERASRSDSWRERDAATNALQRLAANRAAEETDDAAQEGQP